MALWRVASCIVTMQRTWKIKSAFSLKKSAEVSAASKRTCKMQNASAYITELYSDIGPPMERDVLYVASWLPQHCSAHVWFMRVWFMRHDGFSLDWIFIVVLKKQILQPQISLLCIVAALPYFIHMYTAIQVTNHACVYIYIFECAYEASNTKRSSNMHVGCFP